MLYVSTKAIRILPLAAVMTALLLMTACAPSRPITKGEKDGYLATFISGAVRGTPGTVDWAPDGKYLAYLTTRGDQVMLYDPVSEGKAPYEIKDPFFLSWADDDTLLIVHGERESPLLTILDISSKKALRYPLPLGTVAVFGERGAPHAWAYIENHEWKTIGVDTSYALFRLDWNQGVIGEVARIDRLVSIRPEGLHFLRGWAGVAPDPVNGRALLMQLISPPQAPAYLKVLTMDTATLEETEVTRIRTGWVTAQSSWSPDGSRLALTGNDARLKVLSMDGKLTTLDRETPGWFPAWDPRGGQIFFGGYLITDDGAVRTQLVRGKQKGNSAAYFSPTGESMALVSKDNLWLVKGVKPAPGAFKTPLSSLYGKAAKLRSLHRGGIITKDDYRSRLELLKQESGIK